jgi:Protein of unknown function (DUF4236)
MGFRFYRSFSLLPGMRVNISKSQISFGFGPKGANVNVAPRGLRVTAGLPGTGLSYSATRRAGPIATRLYTGIWILLTGCLAVFVLFAILTLLFRP